MNQVCVLDHSQQRKLRLLATLWHEFGSLAQDTRLWSFFHLFSHRYCRCNARVNGVLSLLICLVWNLLSIRPLQKTPLIFATGSSNSGSGPRKSRLGCASISTSILILGPYVGTQQRTIKSQTDCFCATVWLFRMDSWESKPSRKVLGSLSYKYKSIILYTCSH